MIKNLPKPEKVLFLDIETVPIKKTLLHLDDRTRDLFIKKFPEDSKTAYLEKAALLSEFNKIVCVSFGKIEKGELIIGSYCSDDEAYILGTSNTIIGKNDNLCAHNGMGFDYPVLIRKMIQHGIKPCDNLQTVYRKPWEMEHLLDTMVIWKLTSWKDAISLDRLANFFGVPSPKDDIDGSQVANIYYSLADNRLSRISNYCEKDVFTLTNCYMRLMGKEMFKSFNKINK